LVEQLFAGEAVDIDGRRHQACYRSVLRGTHTTSSKRDLDNQDGCDGQVDSIADWRVNHMFPPKRNAHCFNELRRHPTFDRVEIRVTGPVVAVRSVGPHRHEQGTPAHRIGWLRIERQIAWNLAPQFGSVHIVESQLRQQPLAPTLDRLAQLLPPFAAECEGLGAAIPLEAVRRRGAESRAGSRLFRWRSGSWVSIV
jgi:hypothetical protein